MAVSQMSAWVVQVLEGSGFQVLEGSGFQSREWSDSKACGGPRMLLNEVLERLGEKK